MQEAMDFRDESAALATVLTDADDAVLAQVTQFKKWTIDDVIGHLHMWNYAALTTLQDPAGFQKFMKDIFAEFKKGKGHPEAQAVWLEANGYATKGRALYEQWRDYFPKVADAYQASDPEQRVEWAGPPMSTQSKIIARQMETWSHGQEVFDILGVDRAEADRVRNIAHLGVTTYGWTFRNRKEEPPAPKPYVRLNAPSGTVWEWNDPQDDNMVSGSAAEFAQVVTQTRNIADTSLVTVGDTATRWMAVAQCFAGAAETPPAKGVRHKA